MNVYDFDKTIFKFDSSQLFVKYILKKYPRYLLSNITGIATSVFGYFSSKDFTNVKENVFSFLKYIPNLDDELSKFWGENEQYIRTWYLSQRKDDDLVISASPYFLIEPIARKYGFKLIATDMDKYSGNIMGTNTKNVQKVLRYKELFGDTVVDEFYSDSLSDQPMADLAVRAYLVTGDRFIKWPSKF